MESVCAVAAVALDAELVRLACKGVLGAASLGVRRGGGALCHR